MGAISGMGDTYDLPNFVGELFNVTPSDTPLLSMMGGMTGGVSTKSKEFTLEQFTEAAVFQSPEEIEEIRRLEREEESRFAPIGGAARRGRRVTGLVEE